MSDVNNVVLIGRLTRDATLKSTTSGTAVTKFSIAVNKRRKVGDTFKDEAQFFDIVVWGKLAESLNNYLIKGKQVAITGEMTQERWSGDDGQNHSKVTVTAATIQLLSGSGSSNNNAGQKQESTSENEINDGDFADDVPW
jgi:single-strand DNA-binding protein